MGGAVVVGDALTTFHVDGGSEGYLGVLRQLLGDVDDQIVFFDGIDDLDGLVFGGQGAGVAHLTAHLGIERGLVEDDLEVGLFLGDHLAETQDVALAAHVGVADELGGLLALVHHDPVAIGLLGGFA